MKNLAWEEDATSYAKARCFASLSMTGVICEGQMLRLRLSMTKRISIVPVSAQVDPVGIGLANEIDLLAAPPALNGFFSGDGKVNVTEGFEVEQFGDVLFPGKAVNELAAMLMDPFLEVVAQAGIERPGLVGHDVNGVSTVR